MTVKYADDKKANLRRAFHSVIDAQSNLVSQLILRASRKKDRPNDITMAACRLRSAATQRIISLSTTASTAALQRVTL